MSNSLLTGKIEFIQYRQPSLTTGDYKITVTQTVAGSQIKDSNSTFKDTKYFSVAGPRFDLPPQDIYAMFPPPGNHGDHSNVLPHIILNRSTLPWERNAQAGDRSTPWLALLVFHQEDIEQGRVSEPKILQLSQLNIQLETAQQPSDKVAVVDVQKSLLKGILPSLKDLPYLAHVRQRKTISLDIAEEYLTILLRIWEEGKTYTAEDIFKDKSKTFLDFKEAIKQGGIRLIGSCEITCRTNGDEKEWLLIDSSTNKQYIARADEVKGKAVLNVFTNDAEVAVVIANRLPKPGGLTTVHLVSLENRFQNSSFNYSEENLVQFVSLKHWTFSCTNPDRNFKQILLHLNQDTLRLPQHLSKSDDKLKDYLNKGYVALPYYLRKGDKTIAWYHSPLRPCQTKNRLYSLSKQHGIPEQQGWYLKNDGDRTRYFWGDKEQNTFYSVTPFMSMNPRMSDQLLCIDKQSGLFETTYAAAWQLGRMLTVQNQHISVALTQWKRSHVQQFYQERQTKDDPHLYAEALSNNTIRPNAPPPEISTWFDKLNQLQGVPFNYLVPDSRMLPEESIRFFQVDPLWVDCLLDGAFSLGRSTETDQIHDFQQIIASNRYPIMSGLLLRSEAVSGWPGLLIDGYYKLPQGIELTDEMVDEVINLSALPKLKQSLHRISIPLPKQIRIQYEIDTATWTLTDLDTNSDYAEMIVGEDAHPLLCMIMPDRDRQYNYTIINQNDNKECYLKLPLLRTEHLANDILICLFQGDIQRVDIHLKPETLHFGLKPGFSKDLKDENGKEKSHSEISLNNEDWKVSPGSSNSPGTRSLNIAKIAERIQGKLNAEITSAQFALQMIEGTELVRFKV